MCWYALTAVYNKYNPFYVEIFGAMSIVFHIKSANTVTSVLWNNTMSVNRMENQLKINLNLINYHN